MYSFSLSFENISIQNNTYTTEKVQCFILGNHLQHEIKLFWKMDKG